jgi:hypothetical protein
MMLRIVKLPAVVPVWLHRAYLRGHLTRREWAEQDRLYRYWRSLPR